MPKAAIALSALALVVLVGGYALHAASIPVYTPPEAATESLAESATTTPSATAESSLTLAQVAGHASAASCYTAIEGNVYDLTSWISKHPGGPDRILSICGTDGTAAFEGQHGGQGKPNAILATFKIGVLKE